MYESGVRVLSHLSLSRHLYPRPSLFLALFNSYNMGILWVYNILIFFLHLWYNYDNNKEMQNC